MIYCHLSLQSNYYYYSLIEVDIFAQIAHGFYVRALNHIRVEGEAGIIESTTAAVPRSSDRALYPSFTGRGFATLNYSQTDNVRVQWTLSSLPSSTQYQIAFLYSNHDRRSRRLSVTVIQEDQNINARVTFTADCSTCTTLLTGPSPGAVFTPLNLTLTESMVSIFITLSSVELSLDAIVAVPQAFYDPQSLSNSVLFLATCNIFSQLNL